MEKNEFNNAVRELYSACLSLSANETQESITQYMQAFLSYHAQLNAYEDAGGDVDSVIISVSREHSENENDSVVKMMRKWIHLINESSVSC